MAYGLHKPLDWYWATGFHVPKEPPNSGFGDTPGGGAGAYGGRDGHAVPPRDSRPGRVRPADDGVQDRKSTRLNSSHEWISYAVFCLKKKKTKHRKQ